jgi:PDZ domain/Aspartyl protease
MFQDNIPTRGRSALVLYASLLFAVPSAAQEPIEKPAPVVVPFKMLPSNHMLVEVKLNDKGPYKLIFDVGSPVTLLTNRAAKGCGLIKDGPSFPMLFGARGEAEVKKLEFGDLKAEDVPVLIMDHPVVKALGEILGEPIDGLMGHSFFARYRTTIDYQAKQMSLEPVEGEIRDLFAELPERLMGPKKAKRIILEPAGLFGLSVGPPDDDETVGVPILTVLPDSPASVAGLKPGDILTTLDGRWTTSVADVYAAAADVVPDKPVDLVVIREGEEKTLALTPRAGF